MNHVLATEAVGSRPRGSLVLASRTRSRSSTSGSSSRRRVTTPTLASLGWDARRGGDYRPHDRPDQSPARVCRVERGVCTVLSSDGVGRASVAGSLLAVAARDAARLPCPGDWVVVRRWPDARPTVEAVLPRRGIVWRTPGPRPSASNVDLMLAVDGSDGPDPQLIGALRALAAPGRTLGVVGADPRARAAVVAALTGATVLPPANGALVPLPGGGAVIDLEARPTGGAGDGASPDGAGEAARRVLVGIDCDSIDVHPNYPSPRAGSTCPDVR